MQVRAVQRLDRVDREHAEPAIRSDAREHALDVRLGEHVERRFADAEPARAQRDLIERLLARHVARGRAHGEIRERAQKQRRLADARVAAEQHDAAGDEPAAEHAVELAEPGRDATDASRVEPVEPRERDLPDCAGIACRLSRGRS